MLISLFMKVIPKNENKLTFIHTLEKSYQKFLSYALRGKNPYGILAGTFSLLFLAAGLMYLFPPKILFFPDTEAKQVFVFLEYPIGTDIEETNLLSKRIESDIVNHLTQYETDGENFLATSVIGQVGEGTAD